MKLSNDTHNRFIATVWHGESKSLFYVVDAEATEENQPYIVATFDSREEADELVNELESFWNADAES